MSDTDLAASLRQIATWVVGSAPRATLRDAADRLERLRSQLPEGMRDCTIRFCECEKGHGWLTADNWVQHGCPTCERDRLLAKLARLEGTP